MSLRHIRAISLDVTGTLIRHLDPIAETYSRALTWSCFPRQISPEELKAPFKIAYRKTLEEYPCFGSKAGLSSRQWWIRCVKTCLAEVGLREGKNPGEGDYTEKEFNRWFRRVYQQYGCPAGYVPMPDALPFLNWAVREGYLLAVTTNTPSRTMDSVLPFMGLHQYFRCFACSQDVGAEKPNPEIFLHSFEEMRLYTDRILEGFEPKLVKSPDGDSNSATCTSNSITIQEDKIREFDPASFNNAKVALVNKYQRLRQDGGPLMPDQVLHIGDSFAADLCGPKAAGWQAIHLDRSSDPNVRVYQDWLQGPDYEGKSEEDIIANTVFTLDEVRAKLEAARSE